MSVKWLKPNIDSFFDDLYLVPSKNIPDLATDMYEENGNLIVEMNVPGAYAKDMDITTENHYLKVSGSREEQKENKDKNFYKKEIRRGSFERIIELPYEVEDVNSSAEFKNGILKIILLPKKKSTSHHKIKIKS